jgi:hypothetical protein
MLGAAKKCNEAGDLPEWLIYQQLRAVMNPHKLAISRGFPSKSTNFLFSLGGPFDLRTAMGTVD